MDFCTMGKNNWPDFTMQMCVADRMDALCCVPASEYYKIIHIKSGTIHLQVDGNACVFTENDILCLNETDEVSVCKMTSLVVSIVFFKPSVINNKFGENYLSGFKTLTESEYQDLYYLEQFKHECTLSQKIIHLRGSEGAVIAQKTEQLNEELLLQSTLFWPCRSRSYLLEILFALARSGEKEKTEKTISIEYIKPSYSKLTIEVIYYLQTCYNKKITNEMLVQVFHTNRTTLLNDFKKSTGQSINQYLIQLRVTMAATLLRDTELSVNEICERTGFSDISYFSRQFKNKMDSTPTEYRNINAPGYVY